MDQPLADARIAAASAVDMAAVRAYRLARVRAQLRARDYAGCVLFDPLNLRYATDSRNMAVWTLHNAARYCFVPTEGPVIVFDFHNCAHLSDGLETVDEVRPARSWYYFAAGPRVAELANAWAVEIADLVRTYGGGNRRLAIDHCDPAGAAALAREGIEVHDGQEVLEQARVIKSPEELTLMGAAIAVCETGMGAMREALRPGMSENALWSILHQVNIAMGGEWIETRLLSSGPRTNPWFQESGERIIQAGDLVSFDTDLIGPYGYCADISRTFLCGGGRASAEQQRLYRLAWEQIEYNTALLRPGLTTRELAERAFALPATCAPNRYSVVIHGVGLCDEYPHAAYAEDIDASGYDVPLLAGMTVCVESYMGEVGGGEGVKLEQQVLITETGAELLSRFPFEDALMPRQI
ncbi:MAG TPA: Xaa-Pro peptidase family protein [Kiloniellales bacterium]